MAIKVEESDLVDGATVSQSLEGFEATRVFQVTGVPGNREARVFNALNAPGIPMKGEPHPAIPTINVKNKTATPQGAETVRVVVSYSPLGGALDREANDTESPQIEVGATVQEVETNKEIDPNNPNQKILIELKHKSNVRDKTGKIIKEKEETAQGLIGVQVPQPSMSLSRRETANPLSKAVAYVGTMNGDTFYGYPPRTWLCTSIRGTSNDGGETFLVSYEFQFNADKWDPTVIFIDKQTGQPPNDPKPSREEGGIREVQIYPERNFAELLVEPPAGSDDAGGFVGLSLGTTVVTRNTLTTPDRVPGG